MRGRIRLSMRYVGLDEEKKEKEEVEEEEEEEDDMLAEFARQGGGGGDQDAPPDQDTTTGESGGEEIGKRRTSRGEQVIKRPSVVVPQQLERRVDVLSSFRTKTRVELQQMSNKLNVQKSELECAKRSAMEHKKDCENKGAKIIELAHTIETMQREGEGKEGGRKEGGGKEDRRREGSQKQKKQQQKKRTTTEPTTTSRSVRFENLVDRDSTTNDTTATGLQFEQQHEFSLSIAHALNRLRESSTRTSGHSELLQIADTLTPSQSRVVWRALRMGENDGDVHYQRECAHVFGTFAARASRACSSTLSLALEGIARRIVSGGNDGAKNSALVESAGLFGLHVLPAALAGKVQPSLIPAFRPFFDLIRRYPHAQAGAVAARCVGEMLSPSTSKRRAATERFIIMGLHPKHCDGSDAQLQVVRRMLLSSCPLLPLPRTMSTHRTDRTLTLEIPTEESSRFYKVLLRDRHLLPDGWIVAASDVKPIKEEESRSGRRRAGGSGSGSHAPPPPPPDVTTERGESKRHLTLIGSCANELFHSSSIFVNLLCDSEDQTLVAMLDVVRSVCGVARRGLTIQDTRVARSLCACGATVLQMTLDVLLRGNKSFIWRQRRAALLLMGALASLDRDIHLYNVARGPGTLRKDLPSLYDERVDLFVLQDAASRARQDKVNVVRDAALSALVSLEAMIEEKERRGGGGGGGDDDETGGAASVGARKVQEVREVEREVEQEMEREVMPRKQARGEEEETSSRRRHRSTQRPPPQPFQPPPPPPPPSHVGLREYESKYREEDEDDCRSSRKQARRSDRHDGGSNGNMDTGRRSEAEEDTEQDNKQESEENCSYRLLTTLTREENVEMKDAMWQCLSSSSSGPTTTSTVLCEWVEQGAENLVCSFMLEAADDGTTLSRSFALLPRRVAKRVLSTLSVILADLVDMFSSSPVIDAALCRLLRWIYAALNSNHWTADDVIIGNSSWTSVRESVQRLSIAGSIFSRKIHAAKIYALLRSSVLLESHLGIFATEREDDDSDDDDDDDSDDDE